MLKIGYNWNKNDEKRSRHHEKEQEDLKKRNKFNKIEVLKMENIATDIKHSVNRFKSSFDSAKDRVNTLENRSNWKL